jgi:hypothetical protein
VNLKHNPRVTPEQELQMLEDAKRKLRVAKKQTFKVLADTISIMGSKNNG